MTLTETDIGTEFALEGIAHYTCTLVWYSDTRDACGVIPSWSRTGWAADVPWDHGPTEYTVQISSLRRLTTSTQHTA